MKEDTVNSPLTPSRHLSPSARTGELMDGRRQGHVGWGFFAWKGGGEGCTDGDEEILVVGLRGLPQAQAAAAAAQPELCPQDPPPPPLLSYNFIFHFSSIPS